MRNEQSESFEKSRSKFIRSNISQNGIFLFMGTIQSTLSPTSTTVKLTPTPTMLHKLKRTLRLWKRKSNRSSKDDDASSTNLNCNNEFENKKMIRSSYIKLGLLRPMPRCSSFVNSPSAMNHSTTIKPFCGMSLANVKFLTKIIKCFKRDSRYVAWRSKFELAASQPPLPFGKRKQVLNISEAVTGQLTPKGFPLYTDKRKCNVVLREEQQQQHQQQQEEEEPEQRISSYIQRTISKRHRLSFRLPRISNPSTAILRHIYKKKLKKTAMDEVKQLQQELKDLEDYYGAFDFKM